MLASLKEIGVFLVIRKKLWLAPLLVMMVLLGAVLVLAESSAAAPFLYTFF